MMKILFFLLAMLLPWILGFALIKPLLKQRRGYLFFAMGAGYVLGWFIAVLFLRLYDYLERPFSIGEIIALECIIVVPLLFMRAGKLRVDEVQMEKAPPRVVWFLLGSMLLLLCYRWGLTAIDLFSKPVFPWDGWYSWSAKAKAFYYAKELPLLLGEPVAFWETTESKVAFVGGQGHAYFISLVQTYTAMAWGEWFDGIVGLPWLGLGIATVFLVVGGLRYLGSSLLVAILTAYAVISLPMFDIHISLGSYADVWVGVTLFCVICLLVMLLTYGEWLLMFPLSIFIILVYFTKHSALIFVIPIILIFLWQVLGSFRTMLLLFCLVVAGGVFILFTGTDKLLSFLQPFIHGGLTKDMLAFNPVFHLVLGVWGGADNWHYALSSACLSLLLLFFLMVSFGNGSRSALMEALLPLVCFDRLFIETDAKYKVNKVRPFVLLIISVLSLLLVLLAIIFLTQKIQATYFMTVINRASLYVFPTLCLIPVSVFYWSQSLVKTMHFSERS